MTRNDAKMALLARIRHIETGMDSTTLRQLAIATGCTSLVKTVRGIEKTLSDAYAKVQRVKT